MAGLLILTGTCCVIFAEADDVRHIPTVKGENIVHAVSSGDSLYNIARTYNVSYMSIARANKIQNPNLIFPGQKLTIPLRIIIPQAMKRGLLINIPELRLFVFRDGLLTGVHPVSVGLPTWQTPAGESVVVSKVINPAWYMPPDIAERENVKREVIPPGPDNPLGDRWIGTSIKHTGIHGTNQPMSVGQALSHGCVRLYPEDIQKIFDEVEIGDPVIFIYEPVKIYATSEEILIEAHPDVYSLISNLEKFAGQKIVEMNLSERIDPDKLKEALTALSGMPVPVNR